MVNSKFLVAALPVVNVGVSPLSGEIDILAGCVPRDNITLTSKY
jgi:hypothetical protein